MGLSLRTIEFNSNFSNLELSFVEDKIFLREFTMYRLAAPYNGIDLPNVASLALNLPERLHLPSANMSLNDVGRLAVEQGCLAQLGLVLGGRGKPIDDNAGHHLARLEDQWDRFVLDSGPSTISPQDRKQKVAELVRYSLTEKGSSAWQWAGIDPFEYYASLQDEDLLRLEQALSVIKFNLERGVSYHRDSRLHLDVKGESFNCVTAAILSCHLLHRSGMRYLSIFDVPGIKDGAAHFALGVESRGNEVLAVLNNGRWFLPPEHYYSIDTYGDMPQVDRKRLLGTEALLTGPLLLASIDASDDGDMISALNNLYYLLDLNPSDTAGNVYLAQYVIDQGSPDMAKFILEYHLRSSPYNWAARNLLETIS